MQQGYYYVLKPDFLIILSIDRRSLNPVPEKDLEVDPRAYFPADVSFPQRPPWDFNMTPAQLDAQEQRYFKVRGRVNGVKGE